MFIAVSLIHVVAAVILILVILLQAGKGADLGAMLGGGGANTLFGSSGAMPFLSKMTSYIAILFCITCLTLAWLSAHRPSVTVDGSLPLTAPGDQQQPPGNVQPGNQPATGVQPGAPDQPASAPANPDSGAAAPPAAGQPDAGPAAPPTAPPADEGNPGGEPSDD